MYLGRVSTNCYRITASRNLQLTIYLTITKEKLMNNFESFGLSKNLNQALLNMEYTIPTPIQIRAIPVALKGIDILGSAQTGTGKTAAFCIPMIEILTRNENMTALIMTPTRELARQVLDVTNQLVGKSKYIKTACLIGGEAMGKQLNQLRKGPRIIVGTPGRINDHLERKTLDLMDCGYLVLDETDRMLDMGFGIQINQTLKYMPSDKQTLLFSATLPEKIMKLSKKYLYNPERVAVESEKILLTNIKHDVLNIDHNKKYKELLIQLKKRKGSVLIFTKTKHGTQRMAKNLSNDGYKADALNGNLNQNKRDRVMNNFRMKKFKVLVATDIASRGLDVPHIEHVVNYDLPQVVEDYVHRLGRTGRAGAKGSAICFVSPEEKGLWDEINYFLNPSTAKKPINQKNIKNIVSKKRNSSKSNNLSKKKSRNTSTSSKREDVKNKSRNSRRSKKASSFNKTRRSANRRKLSAKSKSKTLSLNNGREKNNTQYNQHP
tara:strand:- start:312 stop:1787 length:1476 start_codon:yes stop_codon:yes gene_type:complete